MTINLRGPKSVGPTGPDTRGLPPGYDPHKFYRYRYETLVKTATGIESFVYKYIPWSIIESFAIALDPTYQFKVAPNAITPFNRSRTRGTASVLQIRSRRNRWVSASEAQQPNFGGVSVCWSPGRLETGDASFDTTTALTTQPVLPDYSDDTTSRTRIPGSKQGTARFFKSYVNSPGRTTRRHQTWTYMFHPAGPVAEDCTIRGGTTNNGASSREDFTYDIQPSAAVYYPHIVRQLRDREYDFCESQIAKHGLAMLKDWNPTTKRDYTLFRNIVELKDIPRSIESLRESIKALQSLYNTLSKSKAFRDFVSSGGAVGKAIPNEYLSYNFGWKQTYKDAMDLLNLPAKLSKKYNLLIERAGKPTTFRTKRILPSSTTENVTDFDYDTSPIEYGVNRSSRIERTLELRLVINATFDFPPLNPVSFRTGSFLDRIGAIPRPTDIYNLIPWTWLVDWFTGLGNYVEQIDNIARDKALINWGMITAHIDGKVITDFSSKTDQTATFIEDFVGTSTELTTLTWNHQSQLVYECQIRKDVAALLDVNTTSKPSLSTYQQSIIGAILSQRGNVKRRPTRA